MWRRGTRGTAPDVSGLLSDAHGALLDFPLFFLGSTRENHMGVFHEARGNPHLFSGFFDGDRVPIFKGQLCPLIRAPVSAVVKTNETVGYLSPLPFFEMSAGIVRGEGEPAPR